MIFSRMEIEEVMIWKWILHTFEIWFALKINYEKKSNILSRRGEYKDGDSRKILGCSRGEFWIKYLGVLLRRSKLKKKDWMVMIKKIQKKLEEWQA